jgi:hypothetical protein
MIETGRIHGLVPLAAGVVLLSTGAALAQRGLESQAMSCAHAAALVRQHGAVLLHTGGGTYDRYVRDQGFCTREQTTEPARVPTRDDPQCFVGYRCVINSYTHPGAPR